MAKPRYLAVAGLRGETYEERCRELKLESLEKRRSDQDMKQAYKIIRGIDKLDSEKLFQFRQENVHMRTADDPYHLTQQRFQARHQAKHLLTESTSKVEYH